MSKPFKFFKLQDGADPIARENPFLALSKMVKGSLGRLPAHLVIIFCLSLVVTVLIGVMMQFLERGRAAQPQYLPQRLMAEQDKPALREDQLRGVWVHKTGPVLIRLRIGEGIFEMIVYEDNVPYARTFIRGGYKIDGNVMVFQERKDLGTPIDPEHFEYKFYPMSFSNINLYAENDGKIMIWRTPGKEARRLENPEAALNIIFGAETVWAKISNRP